MLVLWLVKLYWIWLLLGLILLVSGIWGGISFLSLMVGGVLTLFGLVARKAMQSESLKQRINRNL